VLHTRLFKDYVFVEANLDNYDRHIEHGEHVYNVRNILKLVT